jgi:hypothetical protein
MGKAVAEQWGLVVVAGHQAREALVQPLKVLPGAMVLLPMVVAGVVLGRLV